MIKTALTATCAFALMTGMAFAQQTNGGARGPASPTSKNSGTTLSTGQTQPLTGYSTTTQATTSADTTVAGSATNGPGPNPNGGPAGGSSTNMPSTSASTMPASSMPASTMPATPTVLANTPAGDAPSTYPKCTHKGQDRCISMARR